MLTAVAFVAVALVATACNPPDAPTVRAAKVFGAQPCQVGVVGDSLTFGAREYGALAAKFNAAGCQVTAIDARIGRPTSEGAAIVEAWARAGTLPRVLVVALGTNDCTASTFATGMRRIMAAAGPDRPVVWVNTWRPRCDAAINKVIVDTQLAMVNRPDKGNLWVMEFHGWVAANRGVLGSDGLHLSRPGYAAHADRIVRMVTTGTP